MNNSVHRKVAPGAPLAVDSDHPQDALHALRAPLRLPLDAFMRDAKRGAIEHLSGALRGDTLAAEYALLALLSRAYVRTEVSWVGGRTSAHSSGLGVDTIAAGGGGVAVLGGWEEGGWGAMVDGAFLHVFSGGVVGDAPI